MECRAATPPAVVEKAAVLLRRVAMDRMVRNIIFAIMVLFYGVLICLCSTSMALEF